MTLVMAQLFPLYFDQTLQQSDNSEPCVSHLQDTKLSNWFCNAVFLYKIFNFYNVFEK